MGRKKIQFKLGVKGTCCLLFLAGVVCVILSYFPFDKPWTWWKDWGSSVANAIGTTLIASCVISLILEISNINSIFQGVLSNILNDDFPLDAYSMENLERFKHRICVHECKDGMKCEQLLGSVYKYEKNLLDLANSIYYDFHKANYTIQPKENEGLIEVRAKIEYRVINKFGAENNIRFKLRTYSLEGKNPEESHENNFVLSKFEINGQEVEDPKIVIEEIPKEIDSNYYDYKVKIIRNLGKQKTTTVKMDYTYNVPIYDKTQSYKITAPCKRLEHQIKIKKDNGTNDEWELKTNAFTAFYYKQKEPDSKFRVEPNGSDYVRIIYDDWIIPGGGYVLVFNKK